MSKIRITRTFYVKKSPKNDRKNSFLAKSKKETMSSFSILVQKFLELSSASTDSYNDYKNSKYQFSGFPEPFKVTACREKHSR